MSQEQDEALKIAWRIAETQCFQFPKAAMDEIAAALLEARADGYKAGRAAPKRDPQFYGLVLSFTSFLGGFLANELYRQGDRASLAIFVVFILTLLVSWWREYAAD